jgi:hypothetical protein
MADDDLIHVSQGEIWGKNIDVWWMNFPRGRLTPLRLFVRPGGADPNSGASFSALAELDEPRPTEIDR